MQRFAYHFLIALLLCSRASVLTLRKFDYTLTGIDDANIYFVYAKKVANGHGKTSYTCTELSRPRSVTAPIRRVGY